MIKFVDLGLQYKSIQNEIDNAILGVVRSTHFIQGEQVVQFEKEFAKFLNAKYCIGLNSGTDALILGIKALGLPPGSEVIVPVNTFIATALGATENGLKPVFVDMDRSDYGINLDDLKRKMSQNTKAVIIVHLYGQPDKIDEVKKIIHQTGRKIYLIEDAAQAHGAVYKGKKVGTFGIFSVFSFYPGKNLGAYGDAGAIVTNNFSLAQKVRLLREYGQNKKYYHQSLGRNSRLDTIQAAVLNVKLNFLDRWNKKRDTLAKYYNRLLNESCPEILTPQEFKNRNHIYHLYVVMVKRRNQLLKYLNNEGVQTLVHYPVPLHLQQAFAYLHYKKGDFPQAEKAASQIISLPMYPELTTKDQQTIVSKISHFYRQGR